MKNNILQRHFNVTDYDRFISDAFSFQEDMSKFSKNERMNAIMPDLKNSF